MLGQGYLELKTSEVLDEEDGEIVFQVPLNLARQVERFDNLMLNIAEAIDKGYDTDRVLELHGISDDVDREPLLGTIASMKRLHEVGRNHVWAYYLRNMSRPAVVSAQKVDAIIGNPPWLTYSKSAGIISEELENLSNNQYQIWVGGKNASNQDIATLFFTRAMDLYLRPGGRIGMVLPYSALRSGQHLKWRDGYYEARRRARSREEPRAISADFGVKYPWDLSSLKPRDFFPMVSCVVFATFTGGWGDVETHRKAAKPLSPGRMEVWKGAPGSPDVERVRTELFYDDGKFRSCYASRTRVGADVRDRRLFLVTAHPNDSKFALPNTSKTYPSLGGQDKKNYSVRALDEFVVSYDNVFDVYLGMTLAPYVTLTPRMAVLPVSKESMSIPLDHSNCSVNVSGEHRGTRNCVLDGQALRPNMRARWEMMEELWEANKSEKERKSLFERLNYGNSLVHQLDYLRSPGPYSVRIAYTASGRPTAAVITDGEAILDHKLYQVQCDNLVEAYYLLAIINSIALEDAVAQFRSKGLYGERDLHKHLWKLPILIYDPAIATHVRLSKLGRAAEHSANERISLLRERVSDDALTTNRARNELRHRWQDEDPACKAIEELVQELLLSD